METYKEADSLELQQMGVTYTRNYRPSAGNMVPAHWHDSYEVLYVRRGFGEQRINAKTMRFYPGDVVVICPGDVHATEATSLSGSDIDCVRFFAEKMQGEARIKREVRSCVFRPESEDLQSVFDAMDQCEKERRPEQQLIIAGLAQVLAALLLQSEAKHAAVHSAKMEKVCAYMEKTEDLRLEMVAAHFGYCPEHLSRRFHAEMGRTYRQYCEQIRMRRAVQQLRSAEDVSAIAEKLGYCDSSSFIRAFRRIYGITPSAYRKSRLPIEGEASIQEVR